MKRHASSTFPHLPFQPNRAAWLLGATGPAWSKALACLCLAAPLLALVYLGAQWFELQKQLAQSKQNLAAAQKKLGIDRQQPVADLLSPQMTAAEAGRVNQVVRRLNTPWPALLGALEQASTSEVAVLSVEPDLERGAIHVLTEGQQLDPLLSHAQRVQQDKHFTHVQLLRVETDQSSGAAGPRLSFDVVLAR